MSRQNISMIKQSILLTFLRLSEQLVQLIESTKRGAAEFIHKFFKELTMGF